MARRVRDARPSLAGNLVPADVPVSDDEKNNAQVRKFGEFTREDWMLSHYDLAQARLRPEPHTAQCTGG